MTLRQLQERVNALVNMNQGWLDTEILNVSDINLVDIPNHGILLAVMEGETEKYNEMKSISAKIGTSIVNLYGKNKG